MSNSSRRDVAFEIEAEFSRIFSALGFTLARSAPIINGPGETLLFTGATINAVREAVIARSVPTPGYLLGQDCVRLQNLKFLGEAEFSPPYLSCFRMFSVCASAYGEKPLVIGLRKFVEHIKSRLGASVAVGFHPDQATLASDFFPGFIVDSPRRRERPMTWSYGVGDKLTGLGVDVLVGGRGVEPRSTGQLVQLFSEGVPVGFEFGFGVETLGAAVAGCQSPFDCSELAGMTDIRLKPFTLQAVDVLTTLVWLYGAGVSTGHDARGSTVRKMLRLFPAIAEHAGWDMAHVRGLVDRLFEGRAPSQAEVIALDGHLRSSWEKRSNATTLSQSYVDNQIRLIVSRAKSLERSRARGRVYLESLGWLLPLEINQMLGRLEATTEDAR